VAQNIPSWDETTPVSGESTEIPSWNDTVPVSIPASTSTPTAAVLTAAPSWDETNAITPGLERYYKIQEEKSNYGLGDVLLPGAIRARGSMIGSRAVPKEDVEAVAEGMGVDAEALKALAPFWVAMPPPEEATTSDWAKGIAGRLGYAAGNIPQFLAKKFLIDDPKMREALDEIRELGEGRMGAGEWAAYNILPAVVTLGGTAEAKAALSTLKAAGRAAAAGSVYGLAGSKENQEVQGVIAGALLGGGLGAIAGKLASRKAAKAEGKVVNEAEDLVLDYVQNNEADITAAGDRAYTRVAESEDYLAGSVVKKKPLDEKQATLIIEQQLSPDTISVTKEGLISDYRKANPGVTDIPDEVTSDIAVATKYVEKRKETFANKLAEEIPDFRTVPTEGGGSRAATTEEILREAGRLGEDGLLKKWKLYAYGDVAVDTIKKEGIHVRGDDAPVGKILVNAFGDRQFGVKVIDERSGGDNMIPFLTLNTNSNKLTIDKKNYYSGNKRLGITGIKDIYKVAKAVPGVIKDLASGGQMFRALDSRDLSGLSPEQQKVASLIISFFDAVRERANTMTGTGISPLAIPKREDFGLPQKMVRPVDYAIRMRQRFAELSKDTDLAKLTEDQLSEAAEANPLLKEFIDGVNLAKPESRARADGKSLVNAYKEAIGRGATNPRLHSVASAALGRREGIPDFLREKNVFKLMDRYMSDTLKNVYLREPLDSLAQKANILEAMHAKTDAAYIRRIVADSLGMRSYSVARLGNQARIGFATAVDTVLSKVVSDPEKRQRMVAAMATLPELAANLQYNIYPNVLGLNPKSHIAQLTQVLFKTAPELGGAYGYQSAIKSYLTIALRGKELLRKVKELGLEPAPNVNEGIDALAEGIEKSLLYRVPAGAVRGMAKVFMRTYAAMDTLNRAATIDMSERLVRDVASGDKAAMKAVSKMPLAIKRQVIASKGDPNAQVKVIAEYLNSATQFNYNKASMSELGTIVGPLFSTFTKWPLATAGDIAADLRTKGFTGGGIRAAEKYAIVWALAQAADSLLYAGMTGDTELAPDFKEAGPRTQRMIGRGGITSMTPIESIRPLLGSKAQEKSLITPPVIDTLYKTMTPLLEGDTEKAGKEGMKALTTFTPGAFLWNFTMGTLPKLILDEQEW
jgi:hypothetical protein